MCPPACATIPNTVARPRPVPWSGPFVVKNGSKTRAFTSAVIPTPVSATVSRANRPGPPAVARSAGAVRTVSVPPPGMASRAFTARFITTCSRWVRSARTVTGAGASTASTATRSPSTRRSRPASAETTSFRSSTSARAGWQRPNRRSCRTRAVARSAARARSSNSAAVPASSAGDRSSSAFPRMTVSRLLKSCAIPPASRPTASIFWPWRRCSSSRLRSVMSWYTPSTPTTRPAASRSGTLLVRRVARVPSGRVWCSSRSRIGSPLSITSWSHSR